MWVQFNIRKSIGVIHHMDRLKKKSHTTLSIDAEKSFNKIWYPSMINILSKLGVGGNFFRVIKVIDKSLQQISHILTKDWLPSHWTKKKTRVSTFSNPIQHHTGYPIFCHKTGVLWWWVECIQIFLKKEKNKPVSICKLTMNSVENPKQSTNKLLGLINEFSKVTG